MSTTKKQVVLIDADNISADEMEYLLLEINKFGIASIKRIYGDWTDTKLNKWKINMPAITLPQRLYCQPCLGRA